MEPINNSTHRLAARLGLSLGVLLLLTGNLSAQSCAMCYTTAAGGGPGIVHALKGGILVLLIPPVLMFTGLVFLIFRWQSMNVQN